VCAYYNEYSVRTKLILPPVRFTTRPEKLLLSFNCYRMAPYMEIQKTEPKSSLHTVIFRHLGRIYRDFLQKKIVEANNAVLVFTTILFFIPSVNTFTCRRSAQTIWTSATFPVASRSYLVDTRLVFSIVFLRVRKNDVKHS